MVLVLAFALALFAARCSDRPSEQDSEEIAVKDDPGAPFIEATMPDAAPPILRLNSVEIPRLSSTWGSPDGVVVEGPASASEAAQLTLPQNPRALTEGDLAISFSGSVPPSLLSVTLYSKLDTQGHPAGEEWGLDCSLMHNTSECEWAVSPESGIVVTISPPSDRPDPVAIVFAAVYLLPPVSNAPVQQYSARWATTLY